MKLSKERQGELFIFSEAALWALFPVITILTYNKLSPLVSLGIGTIFAAIFFAVMLSVKKKWHEITNTSTLKEILIATFFIGILYYLFYFYGLRYTSAGNASIIALTEIFFSFLLFNIWKKEPLPPQHIGGALLMVFGAIIILYPNLHEFRLGDILILIGAACPPFGNLFVRRARKQVCSETIMFIRSIISGVIILLLAIILNNNFSYADLKTSLPLLFINGVFLLGLSKVLWIEGIHRISMVKSHALSSLSVLITLLFANIFLHNVPTLWQFFSFIPMFFGIILLGKNNRQ